MSYDSTCKFLAETFPTDFASWLLGEPIPLTKLEPSELTEPNKNMPFRMADYRLRLYRKFTERQIHQVVIYLTPTKSPLVYQTEFNIGELLHRFNIIRMWEQPTEILQQYQGLLPFAPLSGTSNPEETLRQVAKQIDNIDDREVQSNVTAATAIISGLALEKQIIQRLLRSDLMKESVIYQEILLEGKAEGKAEGLIEGEIKGMTKERTQIALNMLHSGISLDLITQITGLSIEQIQKLQ